MDENRVSGTARNVGGKIEEGLGRVTGDTKIQAEGIAKQVSGADQDMYGHARDLASEAAGSARDTALHLRSCCVILLRFSHTRPRSLLSELIGYWAECTVLCSRQDGPTPETHRHVLSARAAVSRLFVLTILRKVPVC
jgi:uncharacterized protein YjbJ (UPF0337 family)